MSRPRYLADNDLRDRIVFGVRRREPTIAFELARKVDLRDKPDPEVLAFAATNGMIVVSHDVITMPAHAANRIERGLAMPGLILAAQSLPDRNVIDWIELIWGATEADEWHNTIRFLSR